MLYLIDTSALWQLKRYIAHLEHDPRWQKDGVRGLLVGPHLRKTCKAHLQDEPHIQFVRLGFDDLTKPKRKRA